MKKAFTFIAITFATLITGMLFGSLLAAGQPLNYKAAKAPRVRMDSTPRSLHNDLKAQGAFEYLLLIGGAILFVIVTVAVLRSALNQNQVQVNRSAGSYQNFINKSSASATFGQ